MTIFRMHRSARLSNDYTGATVAGGRWNQIGAPMLYASQHLALACLEVLVHLDKTQLPQDYVWSAAELPGESGLLVASVLDSVSSCQEAGGRWLGCGDLAIRVPSVIIPKECNVLINPKHFSFSDLLWSAPEPFRFDPRLFLVEPDGF